jgi:hypothetical protein
VGFLYERKDGVAEVLGWSVQLGVLALSCCGHDFTCFAKTMWRADRGGQLGNLNASDFVSLLSALPQSQARSVYKKTLGSGD